MQISYYVEYTICVVKKVIDIVLRLRTKVSVFFQHIKVFGFFRFSLCFYYLLINSIVFITDIVKFDDGHKRETKKRKEN